VEAFQRKLWQKINYKRNIANIQFCLEEIHRIVQYEFWKQSYFAVRVANFLIEMFDQRYNSIQSIISEQLY
jgi:hypothetical protein